MSDRIKTEANKVYALSLRAKYHKDVLDAEKKKLTDLMELEMEEGDFDGSVLFEFNNLGLSDALGEGGTVKCTYVQNMKPIFDGAKMERRIEDLTDRETARRVVRRTYTVRDISELIDYVRSLGGDGRKLRSMLNVSCEVDKKALDNMLETGQVENSQLDGTYTVKVGEPYVRFTRPKK